MKPALEVGDVLVVGGRITLIVVGGLAAPDTRAVCLRWDGGLATTWPALCGDERKL